MFAYAGTASNDPGLAGISCFVLDEHSGAMTLQQFVRQTRPVYLVPARRHRRLYATSHAPAVDGQAGGAVYSYSVSPSGELHVINHQMLPMTHAAFVRLDRSERFLLVACSLGGGIAVLPIDDHGALGAPSATQFHHGSPMVPLGTVEDKEQIARTKHLTDGGGERCMPHSIGADPTNRFVAVPDLLADKLVRYRFDAVAGSLEHLDGDVRFPSNTGPRHFVFHDGTDRLYVLNETASSVSVLSYDAETFSMATSQVISTVPSDHRGKNSGAEIVLSDDGRYLYCSNRGHDSIAIFEISDDAPYLRLVATEKSGGRSPRNIAIVPGGQFLYAANQGSGDIVAFRIDTTTGALEATGSSASATAPTCLVFAESAARE